MPHVVLQHCCSDASCVSACPVNCLHPAPGEPDYGSTAMLYVDPDVCIDCGACADVCPIDAVVPDYDVPASAEPFIDLNRAYYAGNQAAEIEPPSAVTSTQRVTAEATDPSRSSLRVAVVGAGPAGMYAVDELTRQRGPAADLDVRVDVYEREPVLGGLARFGVAPDHRGTRGIVDWFEQVATRPQVQTHLGVDFDTALDDEIRRTHHAVINASGAPTSRRLGVPGEGLAGSLTAGEFVAWCTSRPSAPSVRIPQEAGSAVVIGNGNVALDVARLLVAPRAIRDGSAMAPDVAMAIHRAGIEEVSIVARGGPDRAAFTTSELMGLLATPGVTVCADPFPDSLDDLDRYRRDLLKSLPAQADGARIRLRFGMDPREIDGIDQVTGVVFAGQGGVQQRVACGLVVSSIGFRRESLAAFPLEQGGVVASERGRVTPGRYVVGWAKRGSGGQLGHNRQCAQETVASVLSDFRGGQL